jgi:predicted nucleic acid-binding protein
MQTQNVALDSCVVIEMLEKPQVASRLKANFRGKSIRIILCDVVLGEVYRVRGILPERTIAKVSQILGRKIELSAIEQSNLAQAVQLTDQFQICHNGDNKILSLCKARDFILVTFDKMLLKACQFVGVAAFHPFLAGGI